MSLRQAPRPRPAGILSVDVEDYFHVEAFADIVSRDTWETYPRRVEDNTLRLLDLFDECGVTATFFFLGWVAERCPGLVREVHERGHEVAVHSYWHRLVYTLTPGEFREDTRRAKDLVEQAAGVSATGYRAPSYSVTRESLWALDLLIELGFTYDSSIFPIRHDVYGIPDAPRGPFRWRTPAGTLTEFPITTFRTIVGPNLPVAGGGYLRILPYWYTRLGIGQAARDGLPIITYLHPWEVDPDQPRLRGRRLSRFRHYANLGKTAGRVKKLCAAVQYGSFRDTMAKLDPAEVPEWDRRSAAGLSA